MSNENLVEVGPQLTPTIVVKALTDEIDRCWRIKSVFSPSLDYVEASENHNSDHLAENDLSATAEGHPLIDSIFSWSRSQIKSNSEVGEFAAAVQRMCEDRGTIDDTAPGEIELSFKGFFSDIQTMEAFELGYHVGKIIRNITSVTAVVCDLDGNPMGYSENYAITWNEISDIDWSLRENNYMSLNFSARLEGTFRCSMPITEEEESCLSKPILKFHFNSLSE